MASGTCQPVVTPSFPGIGKLVWYKFSALVGAKDRAYVNNQAKLDYQVALKTTRAVQSSMGGGSRTAKVPMKAKAGSKKSRQKLVTEITNPLGSWCKKEGGSVFDGLSELERHAALSYYYEHPEELPDRETEAMKRASRKPLRILVDFELDIFQRDVCLRPIPKEDLEDVGPFTVRPHMPQKTIRLVTETYRDSVLYDPLTPSLDDI